MGFFDSLNPLEMFGDGGNAMMNPFDFDFSGGMPGMPGGNSASGMPGMPGMGGEGGMSFPGMPGGSEGGMGGMDFLNPMSMFGGGGDSGGGGMFAGMSGGGFLGGLTGSEAIYGRKPLPVHAPSPTEILRANVNANLAAAPDVNRLAAINDQSQQDRLLAAFERSTPGFKDLQATRLKNIRERFGGLPSSVVDEVWRDAAARGAGSGMLNSGKWTGDDGLRQLGIDKLAWEKSAEEDSNRLIENTRKYTIPKPFDVSEFLLRPSYDPYTEFKNDLFKANVDAAPVPAAAGAAAAQAALVSQILGIYSGGQAPDTSIYKPQNYGGVTTTPNYYNGSQPTGDSTGFGSDSMWA